MCGHFFMKTIKAYPISYPLMGKVQVDQVYFHYLNITFFHNLERPKEEEIEEDIVLKLDIENAGFGHLN